MIGFEDNVVCVKCGCVITIHRWDRETPGPYMCYRCHSAKIDICERGMNRLEIIKSIEEANQCQISDYYVPRNRIGASK